MAKRRNYSPDFKARVALAALGNEKTVAELSIVSQCKLLKLSRSGFYYRSSSETAYNLGLMREIDMAALEWPFFGVRQMSRYLRNLGYQVGVKRVRRLIRLMA